MTTTIEETAHRVEIDVDLQKDVACAADGCEGRARWAIRTGPCGHGWASCDSHKADYEQIVTPCIYDSARANVMCSVCFGAVTDRCWRQL